jgi:hypothetical protein
MNCALPAKKANGVQFLICAKNADLFEMRTEYPGLAQQNPLDLGQ